MTSDSDVTVEQHLPSVSIADNAESSTAVSNANSEVNEQVLFDDVGSVQTTRDIISESNVAVTSVLSITDDDESLQTPLSVSNAVVRRLSKPKAKRAKLEPVVSEEESSASDSTVDDVTDDKKVDKHDNMFVWDTPSRRSTDFCYGNGCFIAQKSQMKDLIDQINKTSNCNTENCKGLLRPVSVQMVGFGGTVRINYDCTGCVERRLTFNSSAVTAHDQPDLSLALQVGFVVAMLSMKSC